MTYGIPPSSAPLFLFLPCLFFFFSARKPVQAPEMEPLAEEGIGQNHNPLDPPFDFTGLLRCIAERFPPPRDASAFLEVRECPLVVVVVFLFFIV